MSINTTRMMALYNDDQVKSKPGEPYWNEGATDPHADYTPKAPGKTEKPDGGSGPVTSKPGEPYWNEEATDGGFPIDPQGKLKALIDGRASRI